MIEVEDCQKRWKALREKFGRETKRKKKRTGEAADFTPDREFIKLIVRDFHPTHEIRFELT